MPLETSTARKDASYDEAKRAAKKLGGTHEPVWRNGSWNAEPRNFNPKETAPLIDAKSFGRSDAGETKLWEYNPVTGYWTFIKSVSSENANQWLNIFKSDEPKKGFVLSKNKPSGKPIGRNDTQPLHQFIALANDGTYHRGAVRADSVAAAKISVADKIGQGIKEIKLRRADDAKALPGGYADAGGMKARLPTTKNRARAEDYARMNTRKGPNGEKRVGRVVEVSPGEFAVLIDVDGKPAGAVPL